MFRADRSRGLNLPVETTSTDTRKRNSMFAALVRFIQEWKRYSRSVRELSRLDDRELADIGLNRSEIERAAWSAAQTR